MDLEPRLERTELTHSQSHSKSVERALEWAIEAAIGYVRRDDGRFQSAANAFSPEDRARLETALPRYFRQPKHDELQTRGVTDQGLIATSAFAKFLEKWASSFSRTCTLSGKGATHPPPPA